jgi:outer membrane lipoprotein carrier protein
MLLRQLLGGVAVLLVLAPALSRAEDLTLNEVILRIQETYQKINSLQAEFHQENLDSFSRHKQRFSGKLYLKKPNMIRMEVNFPQKQKIIINEEEVWIYILEDNQAIVSEVSPDLRTIFSFLLGGEELNKFYQVRFARPKSRDEKGNYLLHVEEKVTPKAKFDKILLTIREKDFYIIQVSLFDLSGGGTQFEIRKIKVNKKLGGSFFIFELPPGVKIQRVGS